MHFLADLWGTNLSSWRNIVASFVFSRKKRRGRKRAQPEWNQTEPNRDGPIWSSRYCARNFFQLWRNIIERSLSKHNGIFSSLNFCSIFLVFAFSSWSLSNGKWHIAPQLIHSKRYFNILIVLFRFSLRKRYSGRYRILLYRWTVSLGLNLVGFPRRIMQA